MGHERDAPPAWLSFGARAVASLSPFALALGHASSSTTWRDDASFVAGFAFPGTATQGLVWAALTRIASLVPIGTLHFRAGLVAAALLGACGLVVLSIAKELLDTNHIGPRLSIVLSSIAALMATLAGTAQREGTAAGGAVVATLLGLLVLWLRPAESLSAPRRSFSIGLLTGVLTAESAMLSVVLFLSVALSLVLTRARASRRALLWLGIGALFGPLPFVASLFVRAPSSFAFDPAALFAAAQATWLRTGGAVSAFRADMGWVALSFALLGALVGLGRASLRSLAAPLVAVVGIDALLSIRETSGLVSSLLLPVHACAFSLLAVGVALGIQTIIVAMQAISLPTAKGAAVFMVMTDLTLVAASAEDGHFAIEQSATRGGEALTDEAFERLAPGACVFVRTPSLLLRLVAARVVSGMRPDVLIVPFPSLGRAKNATELLRLEPVLEPTIRDVSIDGRPGEEALTMLADARPLFTEFHSGWDRRVVSHLVADHLWLRFAPGPLGPSDRRTAFNELRAGFERVLKDGGAGAIADVGTASVLRARVTDAVAEAAMLGDRDQTPMLLDCLGKVSQEDGFASEVTRRLALTKGPVDVRDLLTGGTNQGRPSGRRP